MSPARAARATLNSLAAIPRLLPHPSDYRRLRRSWKSDLVAGLTVGIVALPLALGFGISSGAGPEAGLVTAIIAGIVAAVFGGSNVQVSGPTGAMVVVLAPIVVQHGPGAVVIVSVLGGVLVLVGGVLRLGRLVTLVPWPVIEGFTLGIAVIIFLQQVPSVLGAEPHAHTNAIAGVVEAVTLSEWPAAFAPAGIALAVCAIMFLAERIHPKVPGSIIAIVIVSLAAVGLGIPVDRIGELPSTLPAPVLPPLDWATLTSLAGPAAAVAALAAIESLLSARVAQGMRDTGPFDPDRELVGQGLASIAAGMFGGMPATGAIARTAVNVRSGAQTRVAAIVHGLVLLLVVLAGSGLVSQIPIAALAGVLMFTAVRMVHPSTVAAVFRSGRAAAATFVVTAIVTVSFDLIIAVGIGIAATAVFALRSLAASAGVHREEIPDPQPGDERIEVLRVDGALIFASADRILERARATNATVVILRMSQMQALDATGARLLADVIRELERRGVTVLVKGIPPQHSPLASRAGVLAALRHRKHLFDDLDSAIEHARSHVARASA